MIIPMAQPAPRRLSYREGGTARSLALGYWQLARLYAATGRAAEARQYAMRCLDYGRDEGPYYLGYAYEALARAELLAGDAERARAYLADARAQAALLSTEDEQSRLLAELEALAARLAR